MYNNSSTENSVGEAMDTGDQTVSFLDQFFREVFLSCPSLPVVHPVKVKSSVYSLVFCEKFTPFSLSSLTGQKEISADYVRYELRITILSF